MRSFFGIGLAATVFLCASAARAEDTSPEPIPATADTPPNVALEGPAAPAPSPPSVAPARVLVAPSPSADATSGQSPIATGSEREAPATEEVWYGPQTLIVDGLTVGTVALAAGARSPAAGVGAGVLYGVGAPLVHLAHGRPGMALASFATRVSAPAMGGACGYLVMGAASGGMDGAFAQGIGFAVGTLTGIVAAVVLDAAVYSRVWKKETPTWDGKHTFAPQASVTPSGTSLGVGGVF